MPFDSTDFPFTEKGIADYATTGSGVYGYLQCYGLDLHRRSKGCGGWPLGAPSS